MNLQRIEKSVIPTRLYITCEITGGLHLAEPGVTVGRPSGWLVGCPSVQQTKFGRGLKFLRFAVDRNIRFSTLFSQGTALFQQV